MFTTHKLLIYSTRPGIVHYAPAPEAVARARSRTRSTLSVGAPASVATTASSDQAGSNGVPGYRMTKEFVSLTSVGWCRPVFMGPNQAS